jgi:hypothetical protein
LNSCNNSSSGSREIKFLSRVLEISSSSMIIHRIMEKYFVLKYEKFPA